MLLRMSSYESVLGEYTLILVQSTIAVLLGSWPIYISWMCDWQDLVFMLAARKLRVQRSERAFSESKCRLKRKELWRGLHPFKIWRRSWSWQTVCGETNQWDKSLRSRHKCIWEFSIWQRLYVKVVVKTWIIQGMKLGKLVAIENKIKFKTCFT